jgi:mRNA interferase MazF
VTLAPGQVWLVTQDPIVGNEQAGTRPCLVVPLTTRDRRLLHHVAVGDDGGLDRASWAMCEAVRAVSTVRFNRVVGVATRRTIDAIMHHLGLWFGAP